MLRLFVAIGIPEAAAEALTLLQSGLPGAAWIPEENFHITLRFVGEVIEPVAQDIALALEPLTADPFEIAIEGLGTFGADTRRSPVRALYAAVAPSPPLAHLQRKIEIAVQQAGIAAEKRKFTPHVTLARLKDTPRDRLSLYLAERAGLRIAPFRVETFGLYESRRGAGASYYERLAQFPLQDAPVLEG